MESARYRLVYSFRISKTMVDDVTGYERYTTEALSIEDSVDLTESTTLTNVLGKIAQIHHHLREG